MIVAGLGFRKHATTADLVAAIDAALADFGLDRRDLDALATVSRKAGDLTLLEVADQLGIHVMGFDPDAIGNVESRLFSHSFQSIRHAGTPSVSEAAALAGAGPNSRLLGPRIVVCGVTCAIARGGVFQ